LWSLARVSRPGSQTPDGPSRFGSALFRRGADFLALLGHQLLEALAGLRPGLVAQRHSALAFALAGVLARLFAAAALAPAGVLAGAGVGLDHGAVPLAGTLVPAALALVLAGVQAAADVRLQQQRILRLVLLLVLLGLAVREARSGHEAAQRRRGQAGQPPPVRLQRGRRFSLWLAPHCPAERGPAA